MENDLIIFWTVVAGRFLIPLLIPRFPLPGIILAMVLDGIDQTIFQKYTSLNLDGYQGYDKALDIYYLTIAYLSTMRNWSNLYAYKVSMFLFYYRMIGDLLFQLTHIRALLLIFPNTFEYFFDFYEIVKLRWNPIRLTPKVIIIAAAFIWIFIKLPQEWWIHIAQLDTTDLIKEKIFHVSVDTSFSEIFRMYPLTLPILFGAIVLICLLVWLISKRLPKAEYKFSFSNFKAIPEIKPLVAINGKINNYKELINRELVEKIAMMTLIVIIFAQVIPGLKATNIQLAIGVIVILFANTILTHFIKSLMTTTLNMFTNFILMIVINLGLAYLYVLILPFSKGSVNTNAILFFSLMIGLLVTLYDSYNPYYQARVKKALKK